MPSRAFQKALGGFLFPCLIVCASTPASSKTEIASVEISVQLSPAGSFVGKTQDVEGFAIKRADGTVIAQNIKVKLKDLDTGIELRNKHTLDKLKAAEFPEVVLLKALGKEGKGKGIVSIMGKKLNVEGTYTESDGKLKASFPIQLSSLDISGIRYMGVGVKDTVQLTVQVPVQSQAPSRAIASEGK